jgi:hypothetical protein
LLLVNDRLVWVGRATEVITPNDNGS